MNTEEKQELMKRMFNPKSIAIIGGTDNFRKIGSHVIMSVLACGYNKKMYIINPNPKYQNKKIYGNEVFPSIDKCPEEIDLVGVVVPPNAVVDSIKQVVENDIKTAVIITAGFGEVKTEERQNENKELMQVAEKGGLIFTGPNSMGIYSSEDKTSPMHLGFGWMIPRPGNIAIVSQSGSMGSVICNALTNIRHFVSSGNEASLTLEDYLEYYARDNGTKYIALFAEGLRNASKFKEICSEITKIKPIVFLKAGLSKSGARAANSHTGSIAGSLDIYKSVFKQTGVIYAEGMVELINLVKGAQFLLPFPSHPLRAGIISGGGGFIVHFTDLCEKHGINMVDLTASPNGLKLIEEISRYLPFYWSHNNPVDLVATSDFTLYPKITEMMLNSGCFDIVFTLSSASIQERFKYIKPVNDFGRRFVDMMVKGFSQRNENVVESEINLALKPTNAKLIYLTYLSSNGSPIYEKYDENKVMVFESDPEITAIVLKKLHEYQKYLNNHPIAKSDI